MLDREIIKQANEQADALIKEAEIQVKKALEDYERELEKANEEKIKAYEEQLKQALNEAKAEKKLDIKKQAEIKKDELFKQALNEAIEQFIKSRAYEEYIKNACKIIMDELEDFIIYVNKDDVEIVKEYIKEYSKLIKKEKNFEISNNFNDRGLKAISKDRKLLYDFSLSYYIERKMDELRRIFYTLQGWL
ncbi:MAG: hypothetical protein QXI89_01985 [Candidatus Anstonellales archaeon]